MAAVAVTSFTHTAYSSHHLKKKQWPQAKCMKITNVMTPKVEAQTHLNVVEIKDRSSLLIDDNVKPTRKNETQDSTGTESQVLRFSDERWKNGTWDLNMFVKNGKMDWDSVIVAGKQRTTLSITKAQRLFNLFILIMSQKHRGGNSLNFSQKQQQTKNLWSLEVLLYHGGHG